MRLRVALVGAGPWGRNLLRALLASPLAEVVAVADSNARARAVAASLAPSTHVVAGLTEALALGVDAVLIASPPDTHALLAIAALRAGAHVFVEKPLATRLSDAERCAREAGASGRIASVGHLLRYHPAFAKLTELAREGDLGELRGVVASRLSSGGSPAEEASSVLYRLAPHDLSLLDAVDGSPLGAVQIAPFHAENAHLAIHGVTFGGTSLRLALSRTHASKVRRVAIIGSRRVALVDDVVSPTRVLTARTRGVAESFELKLNWDREIVVPEREPLAVEVEEFLTAVGEGRATRTPFEEGVRVVAALARIEGALPERGQSAARWAS